MPDDAAIITDTLHRVAERVGDPVPLVFQRLFAANPEVEALFVRDTAGLVRGQMFQVTMESLLDSLSDQAYGASLVQIERINHEGLGVAPAVFDSFYHVVLATVREVMAADWSPDMEAAWTRAIDALSGAGP